MEDRLEKAKKIVEEIVEDRGCYLLDLKVNMQGRYTFIKAVVENDVGISLSELTSIARILRENNGFNSLFLSDYQLEVSSPGIGHHLRTQRDFRRNRGRKVKIFHHSANAKSPVIGRLLDVGEDDIRVAISSGEVRELALGDIDYGKVEIEWGN